MRRVAAALSVPLIATAAALAGCGSSSSPPASPNTTVTVTGTFGKTPTVKIPAQKAGGSLYVKTEVKGSGPALAPARMPSSATTSSTSGAARRTSWR